MSLKLNTWGRRSVVAAAMVAFGVAGFATSPAAASAAPAAVQGVVSPASQYFGTYPDPECLAKRDELRAHGFIANCYWHPPLKFGYSELWVG